jgi:hypothetical protein
MKQDDYHHLKGSKMAYMLLDYNNGECKPISVFKHCPEAVSHIRLKGQGGKESKKN